MNSKMMGVIAPKCGGENISISKLFLASLQSDHSMYKTSTYFIKEQMPGTTVPELLHLYKQELQDQSVSNIQIENNDLTFSNETFRFVWNSYANKFSNFKSGRIKIEDNDIEYLVTLEADNSRTLIVAGIIAG